jgi:hypothetical protein
MADQKDRFGETMRLVEQAKEDIYFAERDREILAARPVAQSRKSGRRQLVVVGVVANRGAQGFFLSLMTFVCEEAKLGPAGALSFLTADLGDASGFIARRSADGRLDLVQQESSRQEAVERLGALTLALDLDSRGAMVQHDATRYLIDVLAAGAG